MDPTGSLFKHLQNQLVSTAETDALVKAFQTFFQALSPALPPPICGVLSTAMAELEHQINTHRYGEVKFHQVFSGKGPVAKRLVEHSCMDQILHGPASKARAERVQKLLESLDYKPIADPAQIHDLHHFMQGCFASLQMGNLEVTPFLPYSGMSPSTAKTGYYFQEASEARAHSLVLAGTIKDTAIRFAMFVGTYMAPQLFVHHPQERVWVPFEGTHTLPGLQEALESELEQAHAALVDGYKQKDWALEFEQLKDIAREVFSRSDVLPMQMRGYVRVSEQQEEIAYVDPSGYKVAYSFSPADDHLSVVVLSHTGGTFGFSTAFEKLNSSVQCRLATGVEHELRQILFAITQAEELAEQEAMSP